MKRGQRIVLFAGCVWSVYVIFINGLLPLSLKPRSPTILSLHRIGYGITFHVAYLLTLFAWDGFYSSNLVTLDVGRNFSVSALLVSIPMSILLWRISETMLFTLCMSLMVVLSGLIVLSVVYTQISSFWSLDPLTGWKRGHAAVLQASIKR